MDEPCAEGRGPEGFVSFTGSFILVDPLRRLVVDELAEMTRLAGCIGALLWLLASFCFRIASASI